MSTPRPMALPATSILSVGLSLVAASAQALTAISITSPAPSAGPLYDVQPTIAVAYASDDPAAPLDLGSLKILVNGVDWTAKFSKGAGSASYALATQDALIAGKASSCNNGCALSIQASISDGKGAAAAASQSFDVGPTFQALAPAAASYGSTLHLSVLGLDPDASHDAVVFSSNSFAAPFTTVDPATATGTLTVAPRALTGNVSVSINGVASREGFPFTLLTDFPSCATSQDYATYMNRMLSMADGSLFAWFWAGESLGAPCPPSRMKLVRFFKNPDESFRVVDMSVTQTNLPEWPIAIAVDKTGLKPAVITAAQIAQAPYYVLKIHYHENLPAQDHVTTVPDPTQGGGPGGQLFWDVKADFDQDGNLYLYIAGVYKLSKQDLALDTATLEPMQIPGFDAISCSGTAYSFTRGFDSAILEYDLKSAQLINTVPVQMMVGGEQGRIGGMTLDCHKNEILGFSYGGPDVQFWKSAPGAPVTLLADKFTNLLVYDSVAVAPDGTTYIAVDDFDYFSGDQHAIGVVRIDEKVTPCTASMTGTQAAPTLTNASPVSAPQPLGATACLPTTLGSLPACALGSAQLYCAIPVPPPAAIAILTSTTRWRPQRDSPDVLIDVGSTVELNTDESFNVDVTGKDSTGQVVVPKFTLGLIATSTATSPQYQYRLKWAGPHNGPDGKLLPAGNYTLVVHAKQKDAPDPLQTPEYDGVSLVEVTKVELTSACGLTANPAIFVSDPATSQVSCIPGQDPPQCRTYLDPNDPDKTFQGGLRIFAEAATPQDAVCNQVTVTATISPVIPPDSNPDPSHQDRRVPVYFAPFDVADPNPPDPSKNHNLGAPQKGDLTPQTFLVLPGTGTAGATLTVSSFPGDNYRAAASTSSTWLETFQPIVPSPTGQLSVPVEGYTHGYYCSVDQNGNLLRSGDCNISPMVTVWRSLHVELGFMAGPPLEPSDPQRNFIQGTIARIRPSGRDVTKIALAPDARAPAVTLFDGSADLSGSGPALGNGRFENGTIVIGAGQAAVRINWLDGNGADFVQKQSGFSIPYTLVGKDGRVVPTRGKPSDPSLVIGWDPTNRVFTITREVAPAIDGGTITVGGVAWTVKSAAGPRIEVVEDQPLPFVLYDDDSVAPTAPAPAVVPRGHLTDSDDPGKNPLSQAYVRPRHDIQASSPAAFKRNLPDSGDELAAQLDQNRTTPSIPQYWSVYLQGAFQGDPLKDRDPDTEVIGAGRTITYTDPQSGRFLGAGGSLIYNETELDGTERVFKRFLECHAQTVLHEVGHQFSIGHIGGVMGSLCLQPQYVFFTPEALMTIRTTAPLSRKAADR